MVMMYLYIKTVGNFKLKLNPQNHWVDCRCCSLRGFYLDPWSFVTNFLANWSEFLVPKQDRRS